MQGHSIAQTLLNTPSFLTAHWRIFAACILDALTSPSDCPCSVACTSIRYEATVSYSYFPAEYISQELAHSLNTMNSLEVNVYFDTLNIEVQTTEEVYSFIALLADIGGEVGPFWA